MRAPRIVVGDITALRVDAIVNAANEQLTHGGGVCGAIHRVAGPRLARACAQAGPCPTGEARLTEGYDLPARFVIHAVGPVYREGSAREAELLRSCYRRSLELASGEDLDSIAFPCISTGIYGYPIDAAAAEALGVLLSWVNSGRPPTQVTCCCFAEPDAAVYRRVLDDLISSPGEQNGARA